MYTEPFFSAQQLTIYHANGFLLNKAVELQYYRAQYIYTHWGDSTYTFQQQLTATSHFTSQVTHY